MLALTESHLPLDAHSLEIVLKARIQREQFEKYTADLVWLLLKSRYAELDLPAPSELHKPKPKEKTGAEIVADLLKKLEA